MQSMEPIEGHYFAKERVSDADGYLFFSDYMLKHAYYPEVVYYIHAILDDLLNLGASIEKLDLFFTDWLKEHSKVSERFVSTELEYIFNACRSIFDLLQQIVLKLWDRVQLIDEEENTKKKRLPSSFSKMVLTASTLLSQEEIQKKHAIPSRVAEFYFQQGPFFKWLRDYRDHIKETIELPYDIAPNYNVFVRGRNSEALLKLESYLTTEAWPNEQ